MSPLNIQYAPRRPDTPVPVLPGPDLELGSMPRAAGHETMVTVNLNEVIVTNPTSRKKYYHLRKYGFWYILSILVFGGIVGLAFLVHHS